MWKYSYFVGANLDDYGKDIGAGHIFPMTGNLETIKEKIEYLNI